MTIEQEIAVDVDDDYLPPLEDTTVDSGTSDEEEESSGDLVINLVE